MSLQGLTSYTGGSSLNYAINNWGEDDEEDDVVVTLIQCKCGCGQTLKHSPGGSGFKRGHRQKTADYKQQVTRPVVQRFCECGCGEAIPYEEGKTDRWRYERTKFRPGHSTRRRLRGRNAGREMVRQTLRENLAEAQQ